MKCEKCGKEIDSISITIFDRYGSDHAVNVPIIECKKENDEDEDVLYIETDQNWVGYELSEEEMREVFLCPHCKEFPLKNPEMQVYDIVRVVCFKTKQTGGRKNNAEPNV